MEKPKHQHSHPNPRSTKTLSDGERLYPVLLRGYDGLYSVTKDGKVYQHRRYVDKGSCKYWTGGKFCSISTSGLGYSMVAISNGKEPRKKITVHRLMGYTFLGLKDNQQIDHINGDRADNRLENLRLCKNSENARNTGGHIDGVSPYKGVSKCSTTGRWTANICVDYKQNWLGRYDTQEAAALAYNKASRKLHGEFAYQNNV